MKLIEMFPQKFLKCCKFEFADSTISHNECKKNGSKKVLSGWDDGIGIRQEVDKEHRTVH